MPKRLKNTLFSSVLITVLFIELFSLLPKPPTPSQWVLPNTVTGVLHVHPPKGLRIDPFEWMSDASSKSGIDFVVAVSPEGLTLSDGHFGNTDFFVEHEVKIPPGSLLVFHSHGLFSHLKPEGLSRLALAAFEGTEKPADFFSIISHPSHVKVPWSRFDRFTEGMEIVNFDSQWVRELTDAPFSFLGSLISLPFNQFLGTLKFLRPYPKDVVSWDGMNTLGRGHFGVVGHDLNLNFGFSEGSTLHKSLLEKSFRVAQNILFLDAPRKAEIYERKRQYYSAIRQGRSAIHFGMLYPFSGNDWHLECEGTRFRSGQMATLKPGCLFKLRTPSGFPFYRQVRLFREGELINEFSSNEEDFTIPVTEPGTYRLEVWARTRTLFRVFLGNDTPYILYNPIYVN